MSKETTAMIFAGPKTIGSFGDPDGWRIGLTCQVVDGGSNGPFLICNMPGAPEQAIPWQGLGTDDGVNALLLALSMFYGDDEVISILIDTHNVTTDGNILRPAPYFEIADEVAMKLFRLMKSRVKIGVVMLGPDSSFRPEMISRLVRFGVAVERFASVPNQQLEI